MLAVADGVLTDNENKIIMNKAIEIGANITEVEKKLQIELAKMVDNVETKLIDKNKEKGDLFEGYVAIKFDKRYFKLKEWRGGTINKPNELFAIPVKEINTAKLSVSDLNIYKKENTAANFFYDIENRVLR